MDSIDRRSVIPMYYQLAQHLRQEIQAGVLESGKRLPSERELMQAYDLSRNTVRQAMDLLGKEGLIVRDQGSGTYVSALTNRFDYMLDTFFENRDLLRNAGYTPTVDYLPVQVSLPPEEIRVALRLAEGEETLCHTMIFLADGRPAMFTRDYLPKRMAGLYDFSSGGEGFMKFLDRVSGQRVEYVLVDISPVEAEGEVAETFQCRPGSPVLLFKEIFLDSTQTLPIAFSMNYFNREVVNFRLLTRRG